MGASSSCSFCIAKAEESPCTEADGVAELDPRSPAEKASTSGRSEYYSERCEAMKRCRGQFSDAVALEIEFSKPHWSEVSRLEVAPHSAEEEELNRENRELLKQLREEYPVLFRHNLGRDYVLGRMIAKGGQAEIYEVVGYSIYLMKVFDRGTSLRDLQRSWPVPVLRWAVRHCITCAGMLEDGRFAFLMLRCWGDLRKLIDQAMLEKNVDGIQGPPFPYNGWEVGNGWNLHPADFMLGIALHMRDLHEKGISHRDLKASNILLLISITHIHCPFLFRGDFINHWIIVADFECSIGVLGTGYWRAPEILEALGNASTVTNEQWKKADVYSYGMTCFEIVTGRIPFDGELENSRANRQLVIEGKRPQLPSDLDDAVKDLITKCWAPNPSLRPTFFEIVDMVESISKRQCEFRLFQVRNKLPPQYRLATVQEVREYPIALAKAMPRGEIANLANGFVDVQEDQLKISMKKRSDADHKLARLQHQRQLLDEVKRFSCIGCNSSA